MIEVSEDRFAGLVSEAIREGIQQGLSGNRRRTVLQVALAAFAAACAIAIPTTLVLTSNSESIARANSRRNCETTAASRPQGNARAFDQVAFLSILQDALVPKGSKESSNARAFGEHELAAINAQAERWRPYTQLHENGEVVGNELPAKITSFSQLAKTIKPVRLIDCSKEVRG